MISSVGIRQVLRALGCGSLCCAMLALAGCSGGGSNSSSSSTGSGSSSGSSSSSSGSTTTSAPSTAIVVDGGPDQSSNVPFVSVTVCVPGTTTCQVVDHVILDTGSIGLRLVSPVLNSNLVLPAVTDASGHSVRECYAYVTSYVWGSMVTADVTVAGQTQLSLPVHLIGDTAAGTPASECTSIADSDYANFINQPSATSTLTDTVATFGANGILGVMPAGAQDCGSFCAPGTTATSAELANYYYTCPTATTCSPTTVALASQAANPIALVNSGAVNGISLSLPAVGSAGASTLTGTLTLGVSTTSSDTPPSTASFYGLDEYALFSTQVSGTTFEAVVDSGTGYYLFSDSSVPSCVYDSETEFFCPSTSTTLTAALAENSDAVHARGTTANLDFVLENLDLVSNSAFAIPGIGSPCGLYQSGQCYPATALSLPFFIWGLPFYFGRTVYFVYPGSTAGGIQGPAFGF